MRLPYQNNWQEGFALQTFCELSYSLGNLATGAGLLLPNESRETTNDAVHSLPPWIRWDPRLLDLAAKADREEAIAAIREGLADAEAGRVKPARKGAQGTGEEVRYSNFGRIAWPVGWC